MTELDDAQTPRTQRGVSRRTIVKGAAWSVPAVVIATAAPAAATASGTMRATSVTGVARHGVGKNFGVVDFTATFVGTSPGEHTVTITLPNGLVNGWSPDIIVLPIPVGGGQVQFTSRSVILVDLVPRVAPTSVPIQFAVTGHTTNTLTSPIQH